MVDKTTKQWLHERSLGQDIREFGDLLGEIIHSQESADAYETVESVRTGAIEYRAGERDSREPLREELPDLDAETKRILARAFMTFFELTNIAEERERVRSGAVEAELERAREQRARLGEALETYPSR